MYRTASKYSTKQKIKTAEALAKPTMNKQQSKKMQKTQQKKRPIPQFRGN